MRVGAVWVAKLCYKGIAGQGWVGGGTGQFVSAEQGFVYIDCFSGLQEERFGDYSDFFGGVGAGATCLDALTPGGGYHIGDHT